MSSDKNFLDIFKVSIEAKVAIFLVVNYSLFMFLYVVLANSTYAKQFDYLGARFFASFTLLLFILLLVKAFYSAVTFKSLQLFFLIRSSLLAVIIWHFCQSVFQPGFFELHQYRVFLWLSCGLLIENFFIKFSSSKMVSANKIKEKFGMPINSVNKSYLCYFIIILTVCTYFFNFKIYKEQDFLAVSLVLLAIQIFTYNLLVAFYDLSLLKFCEKFRASKVSQEFWDFFKGAKGVLFYISSINLLGQIRFLKLNLLDSRIDEISTRAFLLKFSEYFKGEFGKALAYNATGASDFINVENRNSEYAKFASKVVRKKKEIPDFLDFQMQEGNGAKTLCDNRRVILGTENYLLEQGVHLQESDLLAESYGEFVLYFAIDHQVIAQLLFSERMFSDGLALVNKFKKVKLAVSCCTLIKDLDLKKYFTKIPFTSTYHLENEVESEKILAEAKNQNLLILSDSSINTGKNVISFRDTVELLVSSNTGISSSVGNTSQSLVNSSTAINLPALSLMRCDLEEFADNYLYYRKNLKNLKNTFFILLLISVVIFYGSFYEDILILICAYLASLIVSAFIAVGWWRFGE